MNCISGDDVYIRELTGEDIGCVLRIEQENFTQPWSEDSFYSMLDSPFSFGFGGFDPQGGLVGYIILSLAADVSEVLDIAVDASVKRRGVGSLLMEHAHSFLKEKGACEIYLEVRQSNEAARKLYLKKGYEWVGIRKNYYKNPKEDAIMMRKELN